MNNLFIAILLTCGIVALLSTFGRRRLTVNEEGERVQAATDLERILAPIGDAMLRRRKNRVVLARRLRQARMTIGGSAISAELWTAIAILGGPAGFIVGLTIASLVSSDIMTVAGISGLAGLIGFAYPRAKLSGRLRARNQAIRRDVPRFISLYARLYVSRRDMNAVFAEINRLVQTEATRYKERGQLDPDVKRRMERTKGRGPYESDLWSASGLGTLVKSIPSGLIRPDATADTPDPITSFALWCGDRDLGTFIEWLREARKRDDNVEPRRLDDMVAALRDQRMREMQRSFLKLERNATIYLVLFCLPLLLAAIFVPLIGGTFLG